MSVSPILIIVILPWLGFNGRGSLSHILLADTLPMWILKLLFSLISIVFGRHLRRVHLWRLLQLLLAWWVAGVLSRLLLWVGRLIQFHLLPPSVHIPNEAIVRILSPDHAICTKDFVHNLLLVLISYGCLEGILKFIAILLTCTLFSNKWTLWRCSARFVFRFTKLGRSWNSGALWSPRWLGCLPYGS